MLSATAKSPSTLPKPRRSNNSSPSIPSEFRSSLNIAPPLWPRAIRNSPLGTPRFTLATKSPFSHPSAASSSSMTQSSEHDDICQLVREPIQPEPLLRHVRAPEDGAIVTFDGFVRNQSHNRSTLYLDYEAYESMALSKMREIAAELHEKYRIHRVAIVHRLGRLEIGETSVFIAVSAPHRAAAFDACRFA